MGLALLNYDDGDDRHTRFRINLGSNRYWTYAIGNEEKIRQHGLNIIQDRKYTSPILGPLPEHSLGRETLMVPSRLFDRRNRYIQLISFRDRNMVGPAFSEIHEVLQPGPALTELPVIEFKKESGKVYTSLSSPQPVDMVPCKVREMEYSQAHFLNFLGPLVQGVLPQLGNLLGPLLGGGKGGAKGGAGGAGGIVQGLIKLLENPETMKSLTGLLGQVAGGIAGAKALVPQTDRRLVPLPGYFGESNNGSPDPLWQSPYRY